MHCEVSVFPIPPLPPPLSPSPLPLSPSSPLSLWLSQSQQGIGSFGSITSISVGIQSCMTCIHCICFLLLCVYVRIHIALLVLMQKACTTSVSIVVIFLLCVCMCMCACVCVCVCVCVSPIPPLWCSAQLADESMRTVRKSERPL